jgi:hypothetical protein
MTGCFIKITCFIEAAFYNNILFGVLSLQKSALLDPSLFHQQCIS